MQLRKYKAMVAVGTWAVLGSAGWAVLGSAAWVGTAALSPAAAQGQSVEDRLRDALRRSTADLRAAQDNQAALQASLDQAQKQRDMLQQQVTQLTARLAQTPATPAAPATPPPPSAADVQKLTEALDAARRQNGELQENLTRWQGAYQKAATLARTLDTENRQHDATAKTAQQTLAVCEGKNVKLTGVANDILHLYETRSFRSLLLESYEPLLGFKRVELENIVQDNEDRIRDQRYYPGEQPPASPGAPTPQAPTPQAAGPAGKPGNTP